MDDQWQFNRYRVALESKQSLFVNNKLFKNSGKSK